MRFRPLVLLIAAPLWAGAPLKVTVETATYQSGPGREPPPGKPPFEPRILAQVALRGLGPGAVPEFRLWRMPEAEAKALRRGQPVRKGRPGLQRVEGFTSVLGPGTYRIQAPVGSAWNPGESLVVEVFLRGRWRGRGMAPLLEANLPRQDPPGREEMQP